MALDKQIHIYSLDTSAFFTYSEQEVEKTRLRAIHRKFSLKKENDLINEYLTKSVSGKTTIRKIHDLYKDDVFCVELSQNRIDKNADEIKDLNRLISQSKFELLEMLSTHTGVRELNPDCLIDKNVVSVFESALTRTLGMQANNLYNDIIIVQTYYYDVVKDIVINGFRLNNEQYRCLTASAGQIRTKKTVFIKDQLWKQHENTLMCGLTLDKINAKGGVNVNKYLAYLALCNSATDLWENFNIDKCIVVDDMETMVNGLVDYINPETYEITRKNMDVPINHTDGCGMMLPKVSKRNFMVRMPWVKGLLAVFNFRRFIEVNGGSTKICDIYGKEYDIVDDDIQIILTKSQFKMAKYYTSWDEYKTMFKQYNCTAGKCNVEPTKFDYAKLNYQMLQTLSDITDDELAAISYASKENIRLLSTDKNTMLKVFKATSYNQNKNSFQESLMLYPELLQDQYSKETLSDIRASLQNEAWAAKLDVNGIYTFIIPDLYAFCEWLFLKETNPKGLLRNGEVSCSLFPTVNKLDCLRSPHLSNEHCVRNNVFSESIDRWFTTKGIYTSIHDLISKVLMFDVDGDKSLVCADNLIIDVAERNITKNDIVPLYYEMKKAESQIVDNSKLYDGLNAAYKGGKIGGVSNLITKIWNSEDINLTLIKQMCLFNNFVIDFAKTLFKAEIPDRVANEMVKYNRMKTPHFFQYAKKKTKQQVEPINSSCVNRLKKIIPTQRFRFDKAKLGKFDYKKLMYNPKIDAESELSQSIIQMFRASSKKHGRKINKQENEHSNFEYIYDLIRFDIDMICRDRVFVTDVLVKHLFNLCKSKRKSMFWGCYGDIVLENLKRNLAGTTMCECCGSRITRTGNKIKYCERCAHEQKIVKTINRRRSNRDVLKIEKCLKPHKC